MTRSEHNKDEIERLKAEKEKVEKDMKTELTGLEDQLNGLQDQISNMTQGFEAMLKDTLDKMKKKIAEANSQWKKENDSKLMEKFKEITEGGPMQN